MEGKTGKTGLLEISAHWFLDIFFCWWWLYLLFYEYNYT